MKVANPIDRAMLARIKARGDGWVFSPTDFLELGSRDAVDKALSRMAATGTIRRVVRGLAVPSKKILRSSGFSFTKSSMLHDLVARRRMMSATHAGA